MTLGCYVWLMTLWCTIVRRVFCLVGLDNWNGEAEETEHNIYRDEPEEAAYNIYIDEAEETAHNIYRNEAEETHNIYRDEVEEIAHNICRDKADETAHNIYWDEAEETADNIFRDEAEETVDTVFRDVAEKTRAYDTEAVVMEEEVTTEENEKIPEVLLSFFFLNQLTSLNLRRKIMLGYCDH